MHSGWELVGEQIEEKYREKQVSSMCRWHSYLAFKHNLSSKDEDASQTKITYLCLMQVENNTQQIAKM